MMDASNHFRPSDPRQGAESSWGGLHGLDPRELFACALSESPPESGFRTDMQKGAVRLPFPWAGNFIKGSLLAVLGVIVVITLAVVWLATARMHRPSVVGKGGSSHAPAVNSELGALAERTPEASLSSKTATLNSPDSELIRLEAAAAQGDTVSQYQLGNRYRDGKGVPQDENKAAAWYHKAAEHGSVQADVELGTMYWNGHVNIHPVNWERVLAVWLAAAEKGDHRAQRRVGECYRGLSFGVPHDPVKSVEWLQKSADQGDGVGMFALGQMYYGDRGIPRNEALAFQWVERAAIRGYESAEVDLSRMYAKGFCVQKDPAKAYEWARRAAETGNAEAQADLGRMYLNGEGIPKDLPNAVVWSRKAAEQGNAGGQFTLNQILFPNQQGNEMAPEHLDELVEAAGKGNAAAQYQLGFWYAQGKGVKGNPQKAFEWTLQAAENGHAAAQSLIGDMYESGIFVPKDEVKAAEWHSRADRQKKSQPDVPALDAEHPQFYDSN